MEKKNSRTSLFCFVCFCLFVYKTLHDLNFTLTINSYTTNFVKRGAELHFCLFPCMYFDLIAYIQGGNSRSTKSRAIRVSQKVSRLNMRSGVCNAVNPMFT